MKPFDWSIVDSVNHEPRANVIFPSAVCFDQAARHLLQEQLVEIIGHML